MWRARQKKAHESPRRGHSPPQGAAEVGSGVVTCNPVADEATTLSDALLLSCYRRMLTIRFFEERAATLYRDGKIPGFVHLSVGQEAVPAGVLSALAPTDVITSTHRGHGHVLAKGLDVREAFAELFGLQEGSCHGRGGSMHIADPAIGIFGANGIVGAGVPIAAGAAAAAKLRQDHRVAVSFFGDGAISTGAFHEGATLAGAWRLPLVLVCENNQFSEFSGPAGVSIERRAGAYDVDFVQVDGNDVSAVAIVMQRVVENIRQGGRPAFVEAVTFRVRGHYEGDPQRYRDPDTDAEWLARDPLLIAESMLQRGGVDASDIEAIRREVQLEIDHAAEEASAGHAPVVATLFDYVSPAPADIAETPLAAGREPMRVSRSIRAALAYELEHDARVFLAGIDVGAGATSSESPAGSSSSFPAGSWIRRSQRVRSSASASELQWPACVQWSRSCTRISWPCASTRSSIKRRSSRS